MIGGYTFPLVNLGDGMQAFYTKFYEDFLSGKKIDFSSFDNDIDIYFNQTKNDPYDHNNFFTNFTPLWKFYMAQGILRQAEKIWKEALNIVYRWQDSNNDRLHKGTPYYFWGGICILKNDLETGFLLMHQALKEDKDTFNEIQPNQPAYYFVTLDYIQQNQFYRPLVEGIANFLEEILNQYKSSRMGTLNLAELRNKFLKRFELQEMVFSFVFQLFRLKKLVKDIDSRLTENEFSSLLEVNVLFSLCLIIENLLKHINKDKKSFIHQLRTFSSKTPLNLSGNKPDEINENQIGNFKLTVEEILASKFVFRDGSTLSAIDENFALAYIFRNFGAHKIEDQAIIYEKFPEIVNRILYALFFVIETIS